VIIKSVTQTFQSWMDLCWCVLHLFVFHTLCHSRAFNRNFSFVTLGHSYDQGLTATRWILLQEFWNFGAKNANTSRITFHHILIQKIGVPCHGRNYWQKSSAQP